jgi:hypothetical protein
MTDKTKQEKRKTQDSWSNKLGDKYNLLKMCRDKGFKFNNKTKNKN